MAKASKNRSSDAERLADIYSGLSRELANLSFAPPVTHVYNPLEYASDPAGQYLELAGAGPKEVVFLGMNPGPRAPKNAPSWASTSPVKKSAAPGSGAGPGIGSAHPRRFLNGSLWRIIARWCLWKSRVRTGRRTSYLRVKKQSFFEIVMMR